MSAARYSSGCAGLLVLLATSAVCGEVPPDPVVCLKVQNQLCIRGSLRTSTTSSSYEAFLGVPFAKPPVGELRLANPVPNDPWSGIYDARQPKPPCIQRIDVQTPAGNIVGDEDCLYLNVYRPSLVVESLPVVVYIHGGAFQYGSAAPSNVGPEYFMDNGKVILVTVEYRQGALGFLSSGCSVIPGNFGLKDQAMAIRWVKRYIHRFGGDPDLITVAGQSSGAASAQLHMMSPLSRGHFSRAIMMSGSALSFWAAPSKDSAYVARQQLAVLGIQSFAEMSSQDMLATLRGVEAYDLVKSIDNLKQILGIVRSLVVYGPVVEPFVKRQSFLSNDPQKLWDAGDYEPIPWLAGLLPNDGLIFSSLGYKLNADPEIWSQIVPQLPYILTASIELDLSAAPQIKSRFYPDSTSPEWLTSQNLNKLTDMVTESAFTYPLLHSIRSHLRNGYAKNAPISLYHFNFTGPYSYANYLLPNSGRSLGICHSDELIYLFDSALLFPQFAPGSAGRIMSERFVAFMVDFARYGITQPVSGSCQSLEQCTMNEFFNRDSDSRPVGMGQVSAIDRELLAFWDDLYVKQ
ncbi:hypothetical protein quinque_009810 [Culex quinquefasciatus]